jgi:APA family basic amino acid/polyamine antiporter
MVSIIATCAVALMLPAASVVKSQAQISDFTAGAWGSLARWFVALCAVVSCFGCLNGWLLLGGELPASMADAGALPSWLGKRNAAGAPAQSILLGSVITTLLTMMSYTKTGAAAYNFAALLSTATNLVLYLFCALAVARFMRTGRVPLSRALVLSAVGSLGFCDPALRSWPGSAWMGRGADWGRVATLHDCGRRVERAGSRRPTRPMI